MPLPIDSFPSEQPVRPPCDPLTGQGGATPGGSFSSLLNQAAQPAANTAAPAQTGATPQPACPAYSTRSYVLPEAGATGTDAAPAVTSSPERFVPATSASPALPGPLPVRADAALPVDEVAALPEPPSGGPRVPDKSAGEAENDPPPPDEKESVAKTDAPATTVVSYQLIAGQWLPQEPLDTIWPPAGAVESSLFAQAGQASVAVASPTTLSQAAARGGVSTPQRQPAPSQDPVAAAPFPTTEIAGRPGNTPRSPRVSDGQPAEASQASPGRPSPETAAMALPAAPTGTTAGTNGSGATGVAAVAAPDARTTVGTVLSNEPAIGNPVSRIPGRNARARTDFGSTEKFAGPGASSRADFFFGVKSPEAHAEKTTVVTDVKQLTGTMVAVGTPAANREDVMPYSAPSKPSATDFLPVPDLARAAGISGAERAASSLPVAAAVHTPATTSVQAAQIVREIHDIGERVSSVERNSVEVQFDFNETDRLSVRVEYRDGTVHTTFRTNSPELRETIVTEWQAQAAAVEHRSYRVAEPVFNPAGSDQPPANSSLAGDNSGRQRASEQRSDAGSFSPGAHSRGGDSASPAPRAFSPLDRPETSLHLHTFA